jgi:hypothetical protein
VFENRGEQKVKNIARPVKVYALRPEAAAHSPPCLVPLARRRPRRSGITAMAAGVLVALLIAVTTWWMWPTTRSSPTLPAIVAAAAPSIPQLAVAPRLSIVVLPFTNLSSDPDQQYFADAITEDVTTDLSQIPGMFVISRNTAFTYKDKPINAKQIGP